jgi:hypothetical protein
VVGHGQDKGPADVQDQSVRSGKPAVRTRDGHGHVGIDATFTFGDKEDEAHTLTILPKSQIPRTNAQIDQCRPCERVGASHLKNPKDLADALTRKNPIVNWTLNKGQPGLDAPGDSLAIQSGGTHKSISAVVSAPAGTTLYFVCVIHPWMQGKIVVK